MWNCPNCREQVEDTFEVCWNCGTAKDGTPDPSFERADGGPPPSAEEETAAAARPRQGRKVRSTAHGTALIVTTGNDIAGHTITAYLGVVRGIVVRSPGIVQGFLGGLQQMVGGNIEPFREVCEAAREDAYQNMIQHALECNADAVIAMRYDATEFAQGVTEVLAYGTAVRLSRG